MGLHMPSHALTARLPVFTDACLFGLRVTFISPLRTAARPLTLAAPPCAQSSCAPSVRPHAHAGTAQADAGRAESATGAVRAAGGDSDGAVGRGAREAPAREREAPAESERRSESRGEGFASLGLPAALSSRVAALGLRDPTDIQRQAVPALLQGADGVLQSYTGSGKTLAYLLPILAAVGPLSAPSDGGQEGAGKGKGSKKGSAGVGGGGGGGGVEAVVVAPSRELAMQIVREAERVLGEEHKRCVQQLIGGANPHRQEEALKKHRPLIVVGTPGRIAESSRAGRLATHGCRFLVLDEADMLLSHRFRMDMLRILDHVGTRKYLHPPAPTSTSTSSAQPSSAGATRARAERQLVMVSATVPRPVLEAACKWGVDPLLLQQDAVRPIDGRTTAAAAAAAASGSSPATGLLPVPSHGALVIPPQAAGVAGGLLSSLGRGGVEAPVVALGDSLPPNLEHCYIVVNSRHRVDVVRRCVRALAARSAIVFMNFARRLSDVQHKLEARGLSAAALHGNISKLARTNIMASFREGGVRVLLATEVGARGLDVVECDLVVNLELPASPAHYAHRAGRTGRLGRRGVVVSVCEEREEFVVLRVARELGVQMARVELVEGAIVPYEGRMKY
ncbi:hypothetical protein CLOM_g9256 [Closterium sp. NIES-68]|nr:hypothetical protein CLOM_g9256 [Closterium sp. NIES-68]GJP76169.1 hypothetical protein CLOP_g6540 [Closterium sp. NIES-67]